MEETKGIVCYTNLVNLKAIETSNLWVWKNKEDVDEYPSNNIYEVLVDENHLKMATKDELDDSYFVNYKYVKYVDNDGKDSELDVKLFRITNKEVVLASNKKEALIYYALSVGYSLKGFIEDMLDEAITLKEESLIDYVVTVNYETGQIKGNVVPMLEKGLITLPCYIFED